MFSHHKSLLMATILSAGLIAFACGDDSTSDQTSSEDGTNSGDNGNNNNGNNNNGNNNNGNNNNGQNDEDEIEQPGDIDIDEKFDESLLEGARKLSENVLKTYYKSKTDSDYGTSLRLLDAQNSGLTLCENIPENIKAPYSTFKTL